MRAGSHLMPVLAAAADARRRAVPWLVRRAPLLVVSGVLTLALFVQERGRVVSDTKLDLVLDPGRFLTRSLDLWDPAASFGRLQNQAVGYWFPMGPFFWLGDVLGVPMWVVQRAWWSLIVLAALWGLVKLAEALDLGTPASRLIGATAFAIGPGVLIELGTRSPNVVPLALVPLALLPLVHGARGGSPRRAAALSALVVLAMGGINAAVTGAALLVPLLFLLTRAAGPRRRALLGWWVASVALVTSWWWGPLLLQQRYGFEFTAYTEDAAATTSFVSLTEIVRGTGFWLARLIDGGNAWLPAGIRLATDDVAVVGTCLVAGVGLAGLASRRMPERTFLVLCLAAGVATMGAAFGGQLGGPFADQVKGLLDGPLVVIRNVHKLGPLVALPLALGLVHAVGAAQEALLRSPPTERARRPLAVVGGVVATLVVVAASQPLVTREVAQENGFEEVPAYWHEATDWLNQHAGDERTLIMPASTFPTYQWGLLTDEPMQSMSEGSWAVRDIIPFGGIRSTRLLDGFEEVVDHARTTSGLAEALARSGVGYVLVRNDLDPSRTAATDPAFVGPTLDGAPGLEQVAAFGPEVPVTTTRERTTSDLGAAAPRRALEVYRVQDPAVLVTTYDLPAGYAVLGSTEAVQLLADEGVLDDRATVLAADDPELAQQAGRWVITDDLRRRDVAFGLIQDAVSYTLDLEEDSPDTARAPVDRLLDGDEQAWSHVELLGPVRDVQATSYYRGFARDPGSQPYAALDGDPATAWHIAGFREAEDEEIRIRFDEPQDVPSVTVRLPEAMPGAGAITRIEVTTDGGAVRGSFEPDEPELRLELAEGPTEELVVRILEAERTVADLLPPGLAEIEVEGIDPVERVVVTPTAPTSDPATVVLAREPADPFESVASTEDAVLDRLVDLPAAADYRLTGTAVAVPGETLDDLVLSQWEGPDVAWSTSFEGLPAFAGSKALDGDPTTSWVADISDAFPAIALRWDEPRTVDAVRLQLPGEPVLQAEQVIVTIAGEDQTLPIGADGIVDLGGVVTDELRIAPDVADLDGRVFGLVGISELEVLPAAPGEAAPWVDPATVELSIPCGLGPEVRLGDETLSTSARGTLKDLEQLRPLAIEACSVPSLPAGELRVTGPVTGALQVQSLVMEPDAPLSADVGRDVEVEVWDTEHRRVRVGPGDADVLLTLDQNHNPGWQARLDGEVLTPAVVDGWRQAWVVPAGAEGSVEMTFLPGRTYDLMLAGGVLLAFVVVGLVVVPARRRASAAPAPGVVAPDLVLVVAGTVALALAAGPVGLLVPALWVLVRRPAVRVALPVLAMLSMAVLMGFDRLMFSPELAWPGQLLAGLAVAAAMVGPAVWRR